MVAVGTEIEQIGAEAMFHALCHPATRTRGRVALFMGRAFEVSPDEARDLLAMTEPSQILMAAE